MVRLECLDVSEIPGIDNGTDPGRPRLRATCDNVYRLAEANFADQDAPGITWEPSDEGTRGTASKVQIEREKALADTIW